MGFILAKFQENTNNIKCNILSILFCENASKKERKDILPNKSPLTPDDRSEFE